MLNEYRKRRDNIHAWLTAHPGIKCVKPKGAFYLFPDISALLSADGLKTSADFAQALLEKEHVAVTAGEGFDAPGYLRISYATSMEQLREGADRILRFAESLQPAKAARRVKRAEHGTKLRSHDAPCTLVPSDSWTVVEPLFTDAIVGADTSAPTRRSSVRQMLSARAIPPTSSSSPLNTSEIAAIARLCNEQRVPLVVRGAGTGFTGGAVPTRGGVVLSMERMNRILEIDEANLLAVVEPDVITADLQRAVEAVGLFYPPDPASLERSSIGGNVAECAGGPRGFKYGTTRRYVLALEAVLPTGEIVETGSKAVKNVVGYDLTQLLVGSEGTLAIMTRMTLRLIPKPPARATLLALFAEIQAAVDAVPALIRRRVVPAALELVDAESLRAVSAHLGQEVAPAGTGAVLIVEVGRHAGGRGRGDRRVARRVPRGRRDARSRWRPTTRSATGCGPHAGVISSR